MYFYSGIIKARKKEKRKMETLKEELIYKVKDILSKDVKQLSDELETLSQIEGTDVEEIKQREPMRIAKALVEEGIVDSKMFDEEPYNEK